MSSLIARFKERLSAGLRRKSVTTPSRWACEYRVMSGDYAGPFSFKYFPWLRDMHDTQAPYNIGQKSAQMGYTEVMLNAAFYTNDILLRDVLYVLPNRSPDASDFSASRFDAALELSDHLKTLYSDVKNVGHKRAGAANMYIRGSKARAGLKSIPVSVVIGDEIEEFDQDNIPLMIERLSGQLKKLFWGVSTPSVFGHGINKMFMDTSQEHFFFKCPSCSKRVEFKYPDSLVITAENLDDPRLADTHYICTECKGKLPQENKFEYLSSGIWVPSVTGREETRGFHINQMYSSKVTPVELATACIKGRRDQTAESEFFNSKLGMPHEVSGARISIDDINKCMGGHVMGPTRVRGKLVTMGVDQGKVIHYEIDEWTIGAFKGNDVNSRSFCRVLAAGDVMNFEDLDVLMATYGVHFAVIDAHPERRAAFAFSQRFYGHVKMCFYGNGVNGKAIHEADSEIGEPTVTVDRTSWLDQALGRYKGLKKSISLPVNLSSEYKAHLQNPVRVYKEDQNGNPVGRYNNTGPDHLAHARNYAEIAFAIGVSVSDYQNVS